MVWKYCAAACGAANISENCGKTVFTKEDILDKKFGSPWPTIACFNSLWVAATDNTFDKSW